MRIRKLAEKLAVSYQGQHDKSNPDSLTNFISVKSVLKLIQFVSLHYDFTALVQGAKLMAKLAILKLISFKSVVTDYHIEVKLLVSNGFLEEHTETKCTAA